MTLDYLDKNMKATHGADLVDVLACSVYDAQRPGSTGEVRIYQNKHGRFLVQLSGDSASVYTFHKTIRGSASTKEK